DAPSPRTIQRLRHRCALPRLPKRPAPCRPARRLTRKVKQEARCLIEVKPWLGPERLAWELQNVAQLQISPATIKRMKRAMQQAQTPPPPPPRWRFYARHHPHSLWHGDCMEKVFAQFIGLCSSLKWSRHLTNSPCLALPATVGSNAAYKILSACS